MNIASPETSSYTDLAFDGMVIWRFSLETRYGFNTKILSEAMVLKCDYVREGDALKKDYSGRCSCGQCTDGIAVKMEIVDNARFDMVADVSYAYYESNPRAECETELKHAWNVILMDLKNAGALFEDES